MNHNEEVPVFLGGLGDMLPADVLKKVNELLERVHRKDKDHQGSPVFIYAPGSQYVDKQFVLGKTLSSPFPTRDRLPVAFPCAGREKSHKLQAKTQSQEARIRQVHRTADDGAVWRRAAVQSARSLAGGVSHTGG